MELLEQTYLTWVFNSFVIGPLLQQLSVLFDLYAPTLHWEPWFWKSVLIHLNFNVDIEMPKDTENKAPWRFREHLFKSRVNKYGDSRSPGGSIRVSTLVIWLQFTCRSSFPSLTPMLEVMFNSITGGGCESCIRSTADCLAAADVRTSYRGKEKILCGREKRFTETSAVIKSGLSL